GRHRVARAVNGKVPRPDPGHFLALARLRYALPAPAEVERHEEMEIRVAVGRKNKWGETSLLDGNAKFLLHLADDRIFRPFSRLDLAARELPEPGHRFALGTSGQQHPFVRVDERASRHQNERQLSHADPMWLPSTSSRSSFQSNQLR